MKLLNHLFIIALLFASKPLIAEENSQEKENSSLIKQWYVPTSKGASKDSKHKIVLISGVASELIKLDLGKNLVIKKGADTKIYPKPVTRKGPVRSREDGYFEIKLKLPVNTTAIIPIIATNTDGNSKSYQISLNVNDKNIKLAGNKEAKRNPFSDGKYKIWGGIGVNYLSYDQYISFNNTDASVNFDSIDGPSFFLKGARPT